MEGKGKQSDVSFQRGEEAPRAENSAILWGRCEGSEHRHVTQKRLTVCVLCKTVGVGCNALN